MKSLILRVLAVIVLTHSLSAQSSPAVRTEPIRGVVVDATDGVPVRRARLFLAGTALDPIVTDDEGRFAITVAPAIPLTMSVTKAGYARALVQLPAKNVEGNLRIALTRGAALMGRVLDPYGAPVTNAYVTGRLILPPADITPAPSRQFFTRTDALGEYRLGGLTPGRYDIMAVSIPNGVVPANTKLEEMLFGPITALDVARGSRTITLAAGDEIRDVDFTARRAADTCPQGSSRRPPPGVVTATITGRVIGGSGEPLPCAIVRIVSPELSIPSVYTDPQGRYEIESLPAGSYVLEARSVGHITLLHGQRTPLEAETPVVMRDGEQRARVDIVLPRGSIVSGTVTDELGEPVQGVAVSAVLLRRVNGRTTAVSPGAGFGLVTDDRGRYRLIGLDPGAYLIAARATGQIGSMAVKQGRGYDSVFYPGTPDAAIAQRVALEAGRNADGIDITVSPTSTATVTGSVLVSSGQPVAVRVSLRVSGRSGAVSVSSRSAFVDSRGNFVVTNVPPGDYVVQAIGSSSGKVVGMQYVTVVDTDPPPLTIAIGEASTLEGRLTLEGVTDPDGLGIVVLGYSIDPDYSSTPLSAVFSMSTDTRSTLEGGRFRIAGVTGPTRFDVTTPQCEDCFVRSVFVNGADVTDRPFDFGINGGASRDSEIVVSDAGATIEGRATDGRDGAVSTYATIVFPTDRALWFAGSRHMKNARSKPDGSYRVTGLPPGTYFVAAVRSIDPVMLLGLSYDDDVLEQLSLTAQQVTLFERDRRTMSLRLIRR